MTASDNVMWAVPDTFDALFLRIGSKFDDLYAHNTFRPPQMVLQALLDLGDTNHLCRPCRVIKRVSSSGKAYTRRLCLK